MAKYKHTQTQEKPIGLLVLGLVGLTVLVTLLLQGMDVQLFSPKGLIANEQLRLMVFAVTTMLLIAIPTLGVLYFFAWKYRESNAKATYDSRTSQHKSLVFIIWAIPICIMIVLASVMWPATHELAPQKAIASTTKPLTIQVVALRWKWLFIYPEQQVATVNFVQVPVNTPLQFELTADEAPMNSFWIPHLGGQLYAMTGHDNQLNLMADTPGDYQGSAAEINGAGFADMKFIARAGSTEDFDQWVQRVRQSSQSLDNLSYAKLLEPSEANQSTYYSHVTSDLYDTILAKYAGSHHHVGAE